MEKEKIDVIDMIISVLKDHEKAIDKLVKRLETVADIIEDDYR